MTDARWICREWPDGSVYYDRLTGTTHGLSALAAEVLALPLGSRYDPDSASDAIAARLSLALTPEITAAVGQALDQLKRIELI
ncbi:hypothetical protein GCM10025771_18860 [Niveibacterium umoris]|uniref:PqqD family protein of HPr-rel-A system n=1 Tax=Niveibacterium umoris TaxID=1193620 RepID=A0A840BI71_9RHOO|nr:PqqD family protein of HPr-rel-A system [Niveibacterium umoris]